MKPTIKDVAKKANVSVATVSRVINKLPGYTQETEGNIMKLALLTLNGNKKARDILFNYTSFMGHNLDGAASETWNEYTSIVNYLKK